jgi:hypothetical protein
MGAHSKIRYPKEPRCHSTGAAPRPEDSDNVTSDRSDAMGLGAEPERGGVKRPRFSAYSERDETPLEHALEEKWNEAGAYPRPLFGSA